MVLIQLLVPVLKASPPADQQRLLEQTRQELAARFKGLTAYTRSPAKGWWMAPDGQTEQDDVVMVEVVTERFERGWWRSYTRMLAERFQQEEIHLRALTVEMLEDEP